MALDKNAKLLRYMNDGQEEEAVIEKSQKMEPIKILYDIQHFELHGATTKRANMLSEILDIEINLEICDGYELLDKLKTNPNYNFVILHMGNSKDGAYNQAEECRKLSNAIFVAESSMAFREESEVFQYFDEYVTLICKKGVLLNLFKKYGFVSEDKLRQISEEDFIAEE